jgi:cytoskeletal protein RodZ
MSSGERLKKLRLEKGMSLEEVQKKTKIHLNILKALEGDSLTHLNPVYLQGFLKIYCQYLGVDYKDYAQETKEAKEVKPKAEAPAPQPKPVVQKPAAPVNKVEPQVKKGETEAIKVPEFFKSTSQKLSSFTIPDKAKKIIVYALIGIVVIFAVTKIAKFISAQRAKAPAKTAAPVKKETVKQAVAKAATSETKTAAKSTTLSTPKNTGSDIRMVLKARDKCWVTLKVDGKTVFHGMLDKGRSESWKAKDRMDLSLGNAGVIDLEVDGQLFTNLGRRGQALKNIVITRKGLELGR